MALEKIRYARSRDGAQLGWIESGKGSRTLMIAPNSVTNVVDDWLNPLRGPILKALSDEFRVIRYDDRNFGHSARTGAPYGLEAWADDIEAVADAAGLADEPFVLLGQSVVYGCLAFAARAPERLSHLLIYGGKANGDVASGVPAIMAAAVARREIRRVGWEHDDPGVQALITAYIVKDLTEAELKAVPRRRLTDIAAAADVDRYDEAMHAADCRPLLASIKTPTLVAHARGDAAIEMRLGQKLARGIPGAVFVEIDSQNHALRAPDGSLATWMAHVREFVHGARNAADPAAGLSAREREVLDGLCEGLTNDAIAARLKISEKTVRNHLTQVFEKLGVATRTQAALAAMEHRQGWR